MINYQFQDSWKIQKQKSLIACSFTLYIIQYVQLCLLILGCKNALIQIRFLYRLMCWQLHNITEIMATGRISRLGKIGLGVSLLGGGAFVASYILSDDNHTMVRRKKLQFCPIQQEIKCSSENHFWNKVPITLKFMSILFPII